MVLTVDSTHFYLDSTASGADATVKSIWCFLLLGCSASQANQPAPRELVIGVNK